VNRYGRHAVSRSVMGSCRTVLADSPQSTERRPAARFLSRVPSRHRLRASQRYSLADASAGTRVRVGDDVLASLARLFSNFRPWAVNNLQANACRSAQGRLPAERPFTLVGYLAGLPCATNTNICVPQGCVRVASEHFHRIQWNHSASSYARFWSNRTVNWSRMPSHTPQRIAWRSVADQSPAEQT
jgi:hypothetical protein